MEDHCHLQRVLKPKQCVFPLNRHDYGSHGSNLTKSNSGCSSLPAHHLALCCVCCSRAILGLTMVSFLIVIVSLLFSTCWVHASISNTKGHYCWFHVHRSKCLPLHIPHGYVANGDQLKPQDGLKAWCPKDGVVLTIEHKPDTLPTVPRTSSKRVNFSHTRERMWANETLTIKHDPKEGSCWYKPNWTKLTSR